jgi:hypothetical protein
VHEVCAPEFGWAIDYDRQKVGGDLGEAGMNDFVELVRAEMPLHWSVTSKLRKRGEVLTLSFKGRDWETKVDVSTVLVAAADQKGVARQIVRNLASMVVEWREEAAGRATA